MTSYQLVTSNGLGVNLDHIAFSAVDDDNAIKSAEHFVNEAESHYDPSDPKTWTTVDVFAFTNGVRHTYRRNVKAFNRRLPAEVPQKCSLAKMYSIKVSYRTELNQPVDIKKCIGIASEDKAAMLAAVEQAILLSETAIVSSVNVTSMTIEDIAIARLSSQSKKDKIFNWVGFAFKNCHLPALGSLLTCRAQLKNAYYQPGDEMIGMSLIDHMGRRVNVMQCDHGVGDLGRMLTCQVANTELSFVLPYLSTRGADIVFHLNDCTS